MEIVLSEKDLSNAIKLYLAHSGITRVVLNTEFARKLRGEDAGISVALELSDQDLDPQMLSELAMETERARGLNNRLSVSPSTAAKQATPAPTTTKSTPKVAPEPEPANTDESPFVEDDEIPVADPVSDSGDTFGDPAPVATPEELGADPFANETSDAVGNAAESADEVPDEIPEESPFANTDKIGDDAELEFDAPTDTAEADPFADVNDDAPVQPVEETAEAEEEGDAILPDDEAPAQAAAIFG